jgi:hypothetical protein
MSLTYINYKGKKILYIDFRNKNGDENVATLDAVAQEMKKWTDKGLTLSDFRNSKASPAYMARIKQLGNEIIIPMTKKNAAIGLTSIQKVLLTAFNAFCKTEGRAFDTEEDAKEWLIKD